MTKARTLSLFSLQTSPGQKLRDAIITLSHRLGFAVKPELTQPTITHVTQAVYSDDVVIFDGSIEDDKHNYDIAFDGLNRVDHALLVSRTPLPINFYGTRASDDLTCANAPHYSHMLSNDAILKWLEQTLPTLLQRPLIQKIPVAYPCVADYSANAAANRLKKQSQIYISYHSRVVKQAAELSVKLRRGDYHNGAGRNVNFVEPAMLAFHNEALSGVRRWMVLSIISDIIQACEEFWICDSDDYLDSWWKRGELAILAYFKDIPKKIIRYNPTNGERRTLSYDHIPSLSDEQKNRISRGLSDSRSTMMGAAPSAQLQKIARKLGLMNAPFSGGPVWKDVLDKHDVIVECNSRQCINRLRKTWKSNSLLFDIDAFLLWRDPNLFTQSEHDLASAVDHRGMKCKHCSTPLLVEHKLPDRFLNRALSCARSGEGSRLLPLPVYCVNAQASIWQRVTHPRQR